MIAIINYDAGNLASVSNALERLETSYIITSKTAELDRADAVIFPGVGHAKPAMASLQKNGLDTWLKQTRKPLLGICLGMQLLYDYTEEGGGTRGLGLIHGELKKFVSDEIKVPHMGWNTCMVKSYHPLVEGLHAEDYFYYVHSYFAPVNETTIAAGDYSHHFTAIAVKENIMGTQFHPEKSGAAGQRLLQNFIQLSKSN